MDSIFLAGWDEKTAASRERFDVCRQAHGGAPAQTFETSTSREFFSLSHTFRFVLPTLLMKLALWPSWLACLAA